MKRYYKSIILVAIIALLFCNLSCSSQEQDKQRRKSEIEQFAEKINSNPIILNEQNADTLLHLYSNYIKDFPKDAMCDYYLFQMSNLYSNMKNCDSALYCLDRIIKEYPKGQKVGAAYFFKGVVLNDVCLNKEESIKAFQTYIEKFPKSKQVETAKRLMQLDTMRNPENILQQDTNK